MSRRVYFMSGLSLKVMLDCDADASWELDDLIANAAIAAARARDTAFIGRAAADVSGDMAVDMLVKAGIDIAGLDRYSDVPLPLTLESRGARTIYTIPSAEPFNPVWPRFEAGDIMVWGGYFSIDPGVHAMMLDLLRYASARKVTMIYVPYFTSLQVPRVTRVMPRIFDNLELADIVIASADIIAAIFENSDMAAVYTHNISFYARRFFAIDESAGTLTEYSAEGEVARDAAMPQSAIIASIVIAL